MATDVLANYVIDTGRAITPGNNMTWNGYGREGANHKVDLFGVGTNTDASAVTTAGAYTKLNSSDIVFTRDYTNNAFPFAFAAAPICCSAGSESLAVVVGAVSNITATNFTYTVWRPTNKVGDSDKVQTVTAYFRGTKAS